MVAADLPLADGGKIPLRDAFFNPSMIADNPDLVDLLLAGLPNQAAQKIDAIVVDDVRNFLFGDPGDGGMDLVSLNIQRGRDHGIPGYNAVREAYGLSPKETFGDISSEVSVVAALEQMYASPDEVDAWIGALSEDPTEGEVGELLGVIISQQFERLRDGDEFFFLNDDDLQNPALASIINLQSVNLAGVIRRNTRFHPGANVMRA